MAEPVRKQPSDPSLYERDFFRWTEEQSQKLRARAYNDIDWENVAEEIESLGRSERRELAARLEVLTVHLLRWRQELELRGKGWRLTIGRQRDAITKALDDCPSLRPSIETLFLEAYPHAVRRAALEAHLFETDFPGSPPFRVEQVLDEDFLPDDLDGPPSLP